MMSEPTGFFWRTAKQNAAKRFLFYRCDRCKNFSTFPNSETARPKAWCCSRFVYPPKETWLSQFPVENFTEPMIRVLHDASEEAY
jgi:hypothetical protein